LYIKERTEKDKKKNEISLLKSKFNLIRFKQEANEAEHKLNSTSNSINVLPINFTKLTKKKWIKGHTKIILKNQTSTTILVIETKTKRGRDRPSEAMAKTENFPLL
jgi:hypothetical protein